MHLRDSQLVAHYICTGLLCVGVVNNIDALDCDCGQCKELEAQRGVTAAVAAATAGTVENGQDHHNDDSGSVDRLRAQLQEQVLIIIIIILYYSQRLHSTASKMT